MANGKRAPLPKNGSAVETVLVLRTCVADLSSRNGFRWPESGPVECLDFDPRPRCGHGLHGLLWGEGNGSLLDWSADAKWLVVEVAACDIIEITDDGGGKVKFPRGAVVFCGDREGATTYISDRAPGRAIVGGTATAGDGGTLVLRWWDGKRYRLATFYVGEDGIEPHVKYRVDAHGKPKRAKNAPTEALEAYERAEKEAQ